MENNKKNGDNLNIILLFGFFWVFWGWLGFLLALSGFFYDWVLEVLFFFSVIGCLFFLALARQRFFFFQTFVTIFFFPVLAVIVTFLFTTPTVFSGRDQGSLSEAAIRLVQNHQLEFSTPASFEFFKINSEPKHKFETCLKRHTAAENNNRLFSFSKTYQLWCSALASKKALNFPGFYYTHEGNLITHFPVPYIAWLAIFYALFGLNGLIAANAVLLGLFFLFFYFTSRFFLNKKQALLLQGVAFFSLPFVWFSKFTLSENMALALFWIMAFSLLTYLNKPDKTSYLLFLCTATLLFFTRIEGVLFLVAGVVIVAGSTSARAFVKNRLSFITVAVAVLFLIVFAWNFMNGAHFYKEIARAIVFSAGDLNPQSDKNFAVPFLYVLKIFYLYGLLPFFILGIAGIIRLAKQRSWSKLTLFFLAAPTFWYFVDSNISADHPWMMRRFVFSILPVLIFYSIVLLVNTKKILLYTSVVIILFFNLPVFAKYAFLSENAKLLEQTAKLSAFFQNKDLVLVGKEASGNGWSMISGPLSFLYGKQAVYFFNPADLKKTDFQQFDKIYLIVSEKDRKTFGDLLNKEQSKKVSDYIFEVKRLEIKATKGLSTALPDWKKSSVKVNIFEIIK